MSQTKEHADPRRRMYAQANEPQKRAIDQAILLYREKGDPQYFSDFLHHYEMAINRQAASICLDNDCPEQMEDLKQVIAETLWKCAKTYDPAAGVYFTKYCRPYLSAALRDYLRLCAGSFSVKSPWHFRMLQRVNGIYYAAIRSGKSDFAALRHTADTLHTTPAKINALLIEGTAFRHPDSIEQTMSDAPDLYTVDKRCFSGCKELDPEQIYLRRERYASILSAFEQLSSRDQSILCDALGIACPYCGRTKPQRSYIEIAEEWELSSASAVEKLVKRTVKKLRDGLSG